MPFGQVVIGPPGAGKSTYCAALASALPSLNRPTVVVNLDPANDSVPYECACDIRNLITLEEVMEEFNLGPNGGLMYCLEYLERNMDWLKEEIEKHNDKYFLFDCPGQVELYTHHNSFANIMQSLQKDGMMLCCINLSDSHYCSDPTTFIAVAMMCLSSMVKIELPHINVLSKIDLAEKFGRWQFSLDTYTEMMEPRQMMEMAMAGKDAFSRKYHKLTLTLADVLEEYSLVSFQPLCITDKESVIALIRLVDKANGYVFGALTPNNESIRLVAAGQGGWNYDLIGPVQEKYFGDAETGFDDDEEEEEEGERGKSEEEK